MDVDWLLVFQLCSGSHAGGWGVISGFLEERTTQGLGWEQEINTKMIIAKIQIRNVNLAVLFFSLLVGGMSGKD